MGPVPAAFEDIDTVWGRGALGPSVVALEVEPLHGARGALCDLVRLRVEWDGPPTLVAKIARRTDDQVWLRVRPYQGEVGFYRFEDPVPVRVPRCWHAAIDEARRRACVVLDDLGDDASISEATGLTVDQVAGALTEIAALHAAYWGPQ